MKLMNKKVAYSTLFLGGVGIVASSYIYPETKFNYREISTFHTTEQPIQATLMDRKLREVGVRTLPSGEFSVVYIPPIHRDEVYAYNSQNKSTCRSSLSENTSLKEFMSNWEENVYSLDCLPLTDSKEDLKIEERIRRVSDNLEKRINIHF